MFSLVKRRASSLGKAESLKALGANSVTAGLGGIASILIAWRLGPIGRGQYGVVTGVAGTVGILSGLGLYWPAARLITGDGLSRQLLARAMTLTAAPAIVAGAGTAAVLMATSDAVTGSRLWFVAVVFAVVAAALFTFTQQLVLALDGVWSFSLRAWVPILSACAAALASTRVARVAGPPLASVAWVGAQTAITVSSYRKLARSASGTRLLGRVELVRLGLSDHVGTTLQHVGFRLDVLLAPVFLRPTSMATYMLAAGFIEFAWLPSVAHSQVVWRDELRGVRRGTASLVVAGAYLTAIGTSITVGGVWILTTVGPLDAYEGLLKLVIVLGVGALASGAYRPLQSRWLGRGQARLLRQSAVATAIASIVLYPTLMHAFGASGGAVASSLVYFVQLGAALYLARRHANVSNQSVTAADAEGPPSPFT